MNKQFILGFDEIPSWFNKKCSERKAKINYDKDGKIINVLITMPSGKSVANIGDTIVLNDYSLFVIPKKNMSRGNADVKRVERKNRSDE